jgi:hypothetical protein
MKISEGQKEKVVYPCHIDEGEILKTLFFIKQFVP